MGKKKARGNGQGSVYQLANGKWRAAVTLGYTAEGKRLTRTVSTFRTKKEAIAALPELQQRREYSTMTFTQVWGEVRPQLESLSTNKIGEYDNAWRRLSILHSMRISETRAADLQRAIDLVPGGYHPKKAAKNVLGHIYKYALANDIAQKNCVSFVNLPLCPEPEKEVFTQDEIDRIWPMSENGNQAAQYALLMIYCGMRPGELRAQEISKINLQEQYMVGGIKTAAGKNRIIPIADRIVPILQHLLMAAKGHLLTGDERTWYMQYYEMLDLAGIRRLPPGCCRHTFATMGAEAELAPAVLQEIMGHTSYATTLKNYTHVRIQKKVEAVNRL
jgi:integrase